jgi:hypothetical protein
MEIKKQGIFIDCKHCRCTACHGGSFDVSVPVRDRETGIHATAKLRCSVSPARHQVELVEWTAAGAGGANRSMKTHPRLKAALGFVADHRICGNRHICSLEVIRIVEAQGGRSPATNARTSPIIDS